MNDDVGPPMTDREMASWIFQVLLLLMFIGTLMMFVGSIWRMNSIESQFKNLHQQGELSPGGALVDASAATIGDGCSLVEH